MHQKAPSRAVEMVSRWPKIWRAFASGVKLASKHLWYQRYCIDFTVNHCFVGNVHETFNYERKPLAERLLISRAQRHFASRLDGNGAVSVEFDFLDPLRSLGQFRDR
jgi:hypothetical protein